MDPSPTGFYKVIQKARRYNDKFWGSDGQMSRSQKAEIGHTWACDNGILKTQFVVFIKFPRGIFLHSSDASDFPPQIVIAVYVG